MSTHSEKIIFKRKVETVTNAINILQACIYKSVKQAYFLKSFIDTSFVIFKSIMLFCLRTWYLKVKTGTNILNLTTHVAIIFLKNRPVLQTCKYSTVKYLKHWLLIVYDFGRWGQQCLRPLYYCSSFNTKKALLITKLMKSLLEHQ